MGYGNWGASGDGEWDTGSAADAGAGNGCRFTDDLPERAAYKNQGDSLDGISGNEGRNAAYNLAAFHDISDADISADDAEGGACVMGSREHGSER